MLLVTCMSAHLRAQFPTGTDMHLQWICIHKILCKKIIVYEDCFYAILGVFLNIIPKMRFFPKNLQIHKKRKKNPMSHFGEKCLPTDILTY